MEEDGIQQVEYFEEQYLYSLYDIDQEIEEWEEQYAKNKEIIDDDFHNDYQNAISEIEECRGLSPEEINNVFAYIKYKQEQDIKVKFNDLVPILNRYIFSCVNHLQEYVNANTVFNFQDKLFELRIKMEEQAQKVNVEALDEESYPAPQLAIQRIQDTQNNVIKSLRQVQKLQQEHELSKMTLPKAADTRALFYINEEKVKLPEPVKKKDIDIEKTVACCYKSFQNRKRKVIDYTTINAYMLFEKIEFYLFNSFSNDVKLNCWLPGHRKGDEWIVSSGVVINTKKPYGSNDFISYFTPCKQICDRYDCFAKTCRNTTCTGSENSYPLCCFLHGNYGYLPKCYQTHSYSFPTSNDLSCLHKLIALYKSINGIDWKVAIEELASTFDINPQNSFEYSEAQNSIELSKSKMHSFFVKDSYLLPNTQPPVMYINFGRSKESEKLLLIGTNEILIPVSNYIRAEDIAHSTFNFLSQKKLPLLNLKLIQKYSYYPVLLTSDLHFAKDYALDLLKQNAIVTSWYGKEFTCKNIDFKPLEGRKLYYLYNEDSKEETRLLLTLFDLMYNNSKIKLKVLKQDLGEKVEILTKIEFLELAKEKGNYIPEKLNSYLDEIDTYPTRKIDPRLIISPIIAEKDLVILFAPSDYGKTWLAEVIAVAVSEGKDVFDQWEVSKPRKTLLITGEMDKQSHSNRFFDINKIYGREKKSKKSNLIAKRKDINLLAEDGQRFIENILEDYEGIELIIFDNLVTLAAGATFEGKWDELRKWLKALGVTVIMLHHTNREGEYRGSSDIKNKSDFMIFGRKKEHIIDSIFQKVKKKIGVRQSILSDIQEVFDSVYPEPSGADNLIWYIDYEKKRNVKGKDAQMFRAVLNFEEQSKSSISIDIDKDIIPCIEKRLSHSDKKAKNKTEYPKSKFSKWPKDLQAKKIKELQSEGYMSEDMAQELKVSKATIYRVRKATNTREKDLSDSD